VTRRSEFLAVPGSVSAARRFTRETLSEQPGEILDAVELMVSELAANCVEHAHSDFEISIDASRREIRVEARDTGSGRPVVQSPGARDPRGRGLLIVEMMSDAWGISRLDAGKVVWFTLATRASGAAERVEQVSSGVPQHSGATAAPPTTRAWVDTGTPAPAWPRLDDHEVSARAIVLATGADYRRLALDELSDYEGVSVFYAAGPPEAQRCGGSRVGVLGGGNSAAQAAIWLARGGALVTLLHRRSDLRETMSDYLILELERYGVAVRDRSEIAELHGSDGELEAVTLLDGERIGFSFLFLFLGAAPCTDWLGDVLARDEKGFVLTGTGAGADGLLETSVVGIYAAGDVRSGSIKRCATAVGEGAMVVRFVHERLSGVPA